VGEVAAAPGRYLAGEMALKRTAATSRRSSTLQISVLGAALVLGLSGFMVSIAPGAEPAAPLELAWAGDPTPASVAPPRQHPSWTDENCTSCHKTDAAFSHPVGMTPSMKVPADLPLHEGKLACTTCHDNSDAAQHMQARRRHDGLLRGSDKGVKFCTRCHDPGQTARGSMHSGMLGQAHLRWPGQTPRTAGLGVQPADGDSRLCLSCHDGIIARSVGGMSRNVTGLLSDSHPVGMVYRTNPIHAGKIDRSISFTAPSQLNARIRLVEGQVACASCHSPYSAEQGHLVMSNLRSNLCLSCHVDLP
jgi:predicted CXXCH cytochrome family protein